MVYTVTRLAKFSKVSVRTLHWYDKIGLLKPAYYGSNGYRYYEDEQILVLQQILFFKQLGFELRQIQQMLNRNDFDKIIALNSHKKRLQKNLVETKKLIKTIDQTIKHIKGDIKMKEHELFSGFSKEQQLEYEREIIERFGNQGKDAIVESKHNAKQRSKTKEVKLQKEFGEICEELVILLDKDYPCNTKEVQTVVRKHYLWLKNYWTPTKESYAGHGQFIVDSDLRKAYEKYHKGLPEFIAHAIECFAANELD